MAVLATMQVLIAKLLEGSLKRNVTHKNEKKAQNTLFCIIFTLRRSQNYSQ